MYVVCDDVLTIDNPIYLWLFTGVQSNIEYTIELSNEAEANTRYDLFTLTLPDDLNLPTGEYTWQIFESPLTGTAYSGLRELANGVAKVVTTFTENNTYEPTGSDKTYKG